MPSYVQQLLLACVGGLSLLLAQQAVGWIRGRKRDSATVQVAEIQDSSKARAELWAEIGQLRKDLKECQDKHSDVIMEQASLKAENAVIKAENARITAESARLNADLVQLRLEHGKLQRTVQELERVSVGRKMDDKGLQLENKG